MRKRFISLIACGALAASSLVGFAACGGGGDDSGNGGNGGTSGPVTLTVWGAENQQNLLRDQAEAFKAANPDLQVKFAFGICGEGSAFSQLNTDPKSGPDVFAYANDQLINLQKIGALSRIAPTVVERIRETDFEPALESGVVDGKYYGYPFTDNGFFLFYDSSIMTAEEAKDLDSIVAACERNGKKFIFEYTDAWYALSMAFGAGGNYAVTYGGENGTVLQGVTTNLDETPSDSKYSYAALAGMKLNELKQEHSLSVIGTDGNAQIEASLGDETFGACIRGVWEAANIKNHLGENYAATVLPKWKDIRGVERDWYTFAGYKLWGVNAYSQNVDLAHDFAAFLASEEQQKLRYEKTGIEPTNKHLKETDEVLKADAAVQAMYAMIDTNRSILQTSFPGSYWTAAQNFVDDITKWNLADKSDNDIKDRVDVLVQALRADVA